MCSDVTGTTKGQKVEVERGIFIPTYINRKEGLNFDRKIALKTSGLDVVCRILQKLIDRK